MEEEAVHGVGGGFCGEGEEVGGGAVDGDADAGDGNGWRSWGWLLCFPAEEGPDWGEHFGSGTVKLGRAG